MKDKRSKNYRKIWEEYHNACILPGMHVHHRDGNRTNDDPLNLIVCTPEEHAQYHRDLGHKVLDNFIVVAGNNKGRIPTKEHRTAISNAKNGICTIKHTEDSRRKISESMSGRVLSNNHKKSLSKVLKGKLKTTKHKENMKKSKLKYEFHIPFGIFICSKELSKISGISRTSIYRRCDNPNMPKWQKVRSK